MKRSTRDLVLAVSILALAGANRPLEDRVFLTGNGFALSFVEPPGWTAESVDTDESETTISLFNQTDPAVRVTMSVATKPTGYPTTTFEDEVRDYFPDAKIGDLTLTNPSLEVESKTLQVGRALHQSMSYLDPGPKAPFYLWLVMESAHGEPSALESDCFRELVRSVRFFASPRLKQPPDDLSDPG